MEKERRWGNGGVGAEGTVCLVGGDWSLWPVGTSLCNASCRLERGRGLGVLPGWGSV